MATGEQKAKSPAYTLYQCPMFRSFKCLWLIHELGIEDEVALVKMDSINGKDTAEYREYLRSVNPHGWIPALVLADGGVILESGAICMYLADTVGKLAPPPAQRKDYYDLIMYASVTMEAALEFLFWQWAKPGERSTPDPEGIKKMEDKFDIMFTRLTKILERQPFLCGDSLTAADCIVGYSIMGACDDVMFNNGSLVKNFPEIRAYMKRLEERPAYKAAKQAENA